MLVLPRLLEPYLLEFLLNQFSDASFSLKYARNNKGVENSMNEHKALHSLDFLFNTETFLKSIQDITGNDKVKNFLGRIYRLDSETHEGFDWHSDINDDKVYALSLNLSLKPFKGALLEMRHKATREIISKSPELFLGDAVLFTIDPALEHRTPPLEGDCEKMAYAGWFQANDKYFNRLLKQIEETKKKQSESSKS